MENSNLKREKQKKKRKRFENHTNKYRDYLANKEHKKKTITLFRNGTMNIGYMLVGLRNYKFFSKLL